MLFSALSFSYPHLRGSASPSPSHTLTLPCSHSIPPPQVVKGDSGHGKAVDWWGLGVLLHELLSASTPFDAPNHHMVLQKITADSPIELSPLIEEECQALILKLLVREPNERLGNGVSGSSDVKAHPFWAPLDLTLVYRKEYTPEWKPRPSSEREELAKQKPKPKEGREGEGKEEEQSGSGSEGDLSAATDSESEDEWHTRAPPGERESFEAPDLFRGFTFRRDSTTFVAVPDKRLTRTVSRGRRNLLPAEEPKVSRLPLGSERRSSLLNLISSRSKSSN